MYVFTIFFYIWKHASEENNFNSIIDSNLIKNYCRRYCTENKLLDAIIRAEPLYVSMKSHSRLVHKRIKGTRSVTACWSWGVAALDEVTRVQGCIEGCMRWGDSHTYITLFFLLAATQARL